MKQPTTQDYLKEIEEKDTFYCVFCNKDTDDYNHLKGLCERCEELGRGY